MTDIMTNITTMDKIYLELSFIDKAYIGLFGYLIVVYGYDFWKTMVDPIEKKEEKKESETEIRLQVLEQKCEYTEYYCEINWQKIVEIERIVMGWDNKPLTLSPRAESKVRNGVIEYDEVDCNVHTPPVRENKDTKGDSTEDSTED